MYFSKYGCWVATTNMMKILKDCFDIFSIMRNDAYDYKDKAYGFYR